MPRIISFGEALIDAFAEPGIPLRDMPTLHTAPGGAPANVAVALARLGADVGFVGKVGDDEFGRMLIDLMDGEGIDVSHFTADPAAPTMMSVVATPTPTEQDFVIYSGAGARLSTDNLSHDYFAEADLFIYGSVTLAGDAGDTLRQVLQWIHNSAGQTIFDVNLRPALWPDMDQARRCIDTCIDAATILKVNEVELEFLTGQTDPDTGSRQLLERGVRLCCVSLGAEGAYFNTGHTSGRVPVFPVEIANTTGSGDAFVAGLAHQLSLRQVPIDDMDGAMMTEIVRFANACGALAATRVGAMSGLPSLDAVEKFLQMN